MDHGCLMHITSHEVMYIDAGIISFENDGFDKITEMVVFLLHHCAKREQVPGLMYALGSEH